MATGFIGIGIMGEGMAGCLLKAGKSLVVWNRDASKATKLATAYPGLVTVAARRRRYRRVRRDLLHALDAGSVRGRLSLHPS